MVVDANGDVVGAHSQSPGHVGIFFVRRVPTCTRSASSRKSVVHRKSKRALEMDAVDAAPLKRIEEVKEESRVGQDLYSAFGSYVTMRIRDLAPQDAKKINDGHRADYVVICTEQRTQHFFPSVYFCVNLFETCCILGMLYCL